MTAVTGEDSIYENTAEENADSIYQNVEDPVELANWNEGLTIP